MNDPACIDLVIAQGRALVCAIEALGTIQATGLFERPLARLPVAVYKRRPRAIVAAVPARVSEEILSASEHIPAGRPAVWISEN